MKKVLRYRSKRHGGSYPNHPFTFPDKPQGTAQTPCQPQRTPGASRYNLQCKPKHPLELTPLESSPSLLTASLALPYNNKDMGEKVELPLTVGKEHKWGNGRLQTMDTN